VSSPFHRVMLCVAGALALESCAFLFDTETLPPAVPPPEATGLSACVAIAGPPFQVDLTWTQQGYVTGVDVQRRDTHGAPAFVEVAHLDGGPTAYTDDVPCWRWQYDYQVVASNPFGASDASALTTVFTLYLCDGGTNGDPYTGPDASTCG
jgi:hypothetical protein